MKNKITLVVSAILILFSIASKNKIKAQESEHENINRIRYFEDNLNVHITENGNPKHEWLMQRLRD